MQKYCRWRHFEASRPRLFLSVSTCLDEGKITSLQQAPVPWVILCGGDYECHILSRDNTKAQITAACRGKQPPVQVCYCEGLHDLYYLDTLLSATRGRHDTYKTSAQEAYVGLLARLMDP